MFSDDPLELPVTVFDFRVFPKFTMCDFIDPTRRYIDVFGQLVLLPPSFSSWFPGGILKSSSLSMASSRRSSREG
jgi:hypothetical protein